MRYDLAMNSYLNYGWSFVAGFETSYLLGLPEDALLVDLPHSAVKEPIHYFDEKSYQGIFTYKKSSICLTPPSRSKFSPSMGRCFKSMFT
jgi:hypothetical protein